jgi:hypothetical protein
MPTRSVPNASRNIQVFNCRSFTGESQSIPTDLHAIESETDRRLANGSLNRLGGEASLPLQTAERAHKDLRRLCETPHWT